MSTSRSLQYQEGILLIRLGLDDEHVKSFEVFLEKLSKLETKERSQRLCHKGDLL